MLSDNRADVRIYHNGKIKINIPQYVEAICRIQTESFPFDCQFCAVALASPLLNVKEMVVNATSPPVDSYFTGNAEWSLFNVSVRHMRFQEEGEERVEIHYIFHLKRKPTYYLTVIVAPTFLISALSILGIFSSSSNEGPRGEKQEDSDHVSLGLGSLLAMSVLLGIVAGAMPKSNSIPLLGYYILIVILLCAIAVTVSMIFLSVSRIPTISKIPELNMIYQTIEEIAESHRSMRRKLEQKAHKKLIEKEWNRVFTRFDYFFLSLFELLNLAALAIFLRVAWLPTPELDPEVSLI
ncbi:hypothetical protein WR25_19970 [Diploscapter pachys]|uniref:Neurotransmitter-gated ion-channel ligand-binding domain-containing protein n=1 Tax=Diploscapter pachys TaxID=2018661 RepID=A0A2A2KV70_9BILA|nr:hypothetical protein WR25_19970 [Diploscapter pachys]